MVLEAILPFLIHPEVTIYDMQELVLTHLHRSFLEELSSFNKKYSHMRNEATDKQKRLTELNAMVLAMKALLAVFTLPENNQITHQINSIRSMG